MNAKSLTKPHVDVVVIGGGVVGLSCAFALRCANLSVAVVAERRAGEATAVAGGMLAMAAEAETMPEPGLVFGAASAKATLDFVARVEAVSGLKCGLRREGTLLVALHRDHQLRLERLAQIQKRLGVACRWLEAEDVAALDPQLTPQLLGALWAEHDAQLVPFELQAALDQALDSLAVQRVASRAEHLEQGSDGHWEVHLAEGLQGSVAPLSCKHVVVAAGAWSPGLLPKDVPLPMRPVHGQVVRLRDAPELKHVVRTPEVYVIPRSDGRLLVGATEEEYGWDAKPRAGGVWTLLREAWRLLPGCSEATFVDTQVGFRPALPDHMPAIGQTQHQGLWLATGHHRHGVLMAAGTALALTELVAKPTAQGVWSQHVAALSPQRFLHLEDGALDVAS